jgi:hypothetical protein
MFRESRPLLKRAGCGLVGAVSILTGLHFLHTNNFLSYRNWFGGVVFAPIALLLGIVALLGAILDWRRVWDGPEEPRRKR